MKARLILASASPRRKALLEQTKAAFELLPAKGEEVISSSIPSQVVLELSRQKAEEAAGRFMQELPAREAECTVILGSDTVVAYGERILGKPGSRKEAEEMLHLLSGHSHSVFTGVTWILCGQGKRQTHSFYEETKVTMYPITDLEIARYVATGEPMDKAGAYAIQGKAAVFVERMEGDYNTVVGFPIARIYQELKKAGIDIL